MRACVGLVPGVREARAAHRRIDIERDREVVDDHPTLGDRAVVHHRTVDDLDRLHLPDPGVGPDDDVLQVRDRPVVGDGVQVAGRRIDLRMGGEAVRQCAAEVAVLERVEVIRELDRPRPGLDQGERPAAESHHVGVGGVEPPVALAGRRLLAEGFADLRRPHPASSIPLGATVAQAHPVDHRVAREPVVRPRFDGAQGVRVRCARSAPPAPGVWCRPPAGRTPTPPRRAVHRCRSAICLVCTASAVITILLELPSHCYL